MADENVESGGAAIGTTLQNLPISQMLRDLALGVAQAQQALDGASLVSLEEMAGTEVTLTGVDGQKVTKNLLELGFVPNFYGFSEATIDLSFTLSMSMEESTSVSASMNFQASKDSTTTGKKGGK